MINYEAAWYALKEVIISDTNHKILLLETMAKIEIDLYEAPVKAEVRYVHVDTSGVKK